MVKRRGGSRNFQKGGTFVQKNFDKQKKSKKKQQKKKGHYAYARLLPMNVLSYNITGLYELQIFGLGEINLQSG